MQNGAFRGIKEQSMAPIKVLFICHGNICRSPMAEFVMKNMLEQQNLQNEFVVESAATSTEEIWGNCGNPIYPPAREELIKHGIGKTQYTDFSHKRARQVTPDDYNRFDYILCADAANVRNTERITGRDVKGKIHLLMDYTERPGRNISDPWYSGDFSKAYEDVYEGCKGFLEYINM